MAATFCPLASAATTVAAPTRRIALPCQPPYVAIHRAVPRGAAVTSWPNFPINRTCEVACATAACLLAGGRRLAKRRRRRHIAAALGKRGGKRSCEVFAADCDAAGRNPSAEELKFLCEVLQEVKQLPLLGEAAEETIQELAEAMCEVTVPAGGVVVHQGEQCNGMMYVVAEGELEVQKRIADGEVPTTRPATHGFVIGARTLLGNTPQTDTVFAKSQARLWRLDRAIFDEIVIHAQKGHLADDATSEASSEDGESEGDDEGVGAVGSTHDAVREIYVVSDSTGESATTSVRTALRQFENILTNGGNSRTTVFRFVRKPEEVRKIAELAAASNALLVHTVMQQKVQEALTAACVELGVECCDLWGTLLEALERKFGAKRSGIGGRKQAVSEEYMRNIRAIEYTRKVDDGVSPSMWKECDFMIIGPSRAGKTPLAFYLAQLGFKVANYPLVPGEEPPKELFEIDQSKIVGILIQPERLHAIRQARMMQLNLKRSSYADINEIKKEVKWIKEFFMRKGPRWPVIDTTNSGVVETAARILEIMDRRKGDSVAAAYVREM